MKEDKRLFRRTGQMPDGRIYDYLVMVDLDRLISVVGHKATRNKRHVSRALHGAVKVTAAEVIKCPTA